MRASVTDRTFGLQDAETDKEPAAEGQTVVSSPGRSQQEIIGRQTGLPLDRQLEIGQPVAIHIG